MVLWRPTETRDEVGQDDGVLFLQGYKSKGAIQDGKNILKLKRFSEVGRNKGRKAGGEGGRREQGEEWQERRKEGRKEGRRKERGRKEWRKRK